ncbi:hypothetical protein ACHAQA_002527 [Verticillium albo-atrum]
MDLLYSAALPSTGPNRFQRSRSLHPETLFQDTTQRQSQLAGQMQTRYANDQLRLQRSAPTQETLLPSLPAGQPKNAAELAASLVNLVFPYDVRNTQRSLARMYDRVKAVEAKASDDSAARQRAEQAVGALEKEMMTLQALVANARPDPAETMGVEALEREVRQRHGEMVNMVSEFNAQREGLLADINRLVDQTRQLQDELAAQSTSASTKQSLRKDPGHAEDTEALASVVLEKAVEMQRPSHVPRDPAEDISTASESEDGSVGSVRDTNGGNNSTKEASSPAENNAGKLKKSKTKGSQMNKAPGTFEAMDERNRKEFQ